LAVIWRAGLRLAVYLDETMLIPKNTSVIIKRLPKPGQVNLLARLANNAPFSAAMMYGDGYRTWTVVIQMKSVQRIIKYVELGACGTVVCSLVSVCREDLINQWCWNWAAGAPILEYPCSPCGENPWSMPLAALCPSPEWGASVPHPSSRQPSRGTECEQVVGSSHTVRKARLAQC
jgi:hypothetical protein